MGRLRPGPALTALLAAVTAVGAAGCGQGAQVSKGQTAKLTVGVLPITNVAPLYVGIDKGFFKQEKLDVKPQVSEGGAATIPSVLSGDQQIAYSTNVSLVTAASKGLPVQIVSQATRGAETPKTSFAGLMVAKGSRIRSPSQLAGKTIAVNGLANVNEVTTDAALRKRGVDVSTIKYIEVPLESMASSLDSGRVDAAAAVEPFVTLGKQRGQRSLLDNYLEAERGLAIGQYFTTRQYAQKNADVVKRFRSAMNRSMKYTQAHPGEARKAILTYTKIKPAIAERMKLPTWTTGVSRADVETAAKLTKQSGLLKGNVDAKELLPDGRGG
jgi:NitT/TauT family transport system substrate-binding protein